MLPTRSTLFQVSNEFVNLEPCPSSNNALFLSFFPSFRFPQNIRNRQMWVDFCHNCIGDENASIEFDKRLTLECRLCVNHFLLNSVSLSTRGTNTRSKLGKNAVSTIQPGSESLKDM